MIHVNNYFSDKNLNLIKQTVSSFSKFSNKMFFIYYSIGNKIEYLNVGLRKIIHPPCKNLQHGVRLEVDGKLVTLPQLEGLIILNILR